MLEKTEAELAKAVEALWDVEFDDGTLTLVAVVAAGRSAAAFMAKDGGRDGLEEAAGVLRISQLLSAASTAAGQLAAGLDRELLREVKELTDRTTSLGEEVKRRLEAFQRFEAINVLMDAAIKGSESFELPVAGAGPAEAPFGTLLAYAVRSLLKGERMDAQDDNEGFVRWARRACAGDERVQGCLPHLGES